MRNEPYRRVAATVALTVVALWALLRIPQAEAVAVPFSLLTAEWTAAELGWLGVPVARELTILRHADGFECDIGLACTVLIPLLLLAAAVSASGGRPMRRVIGVLGAALMLLIVNQIRLTSLVWLGVHREAWLDPAHSILWPLALTASCVVYWRSWMRAAIPR